MHRKKSNKEKKYFYHYFCKISKVHFFHKKGLSFVMNNSHNQVPNGLESFLNSNSHFGATKPLFICSWFLKNQCYFELDFYCLCSLQNSSSDSTKNQVHPTWFFKLDFSKIKCRSIGGFLWTRIVLSKTLVSWLISVAFWKIITGHITRLILTNSTWKPPLCISEVHRNEKVTSEMTLPHLC